MALYNLARVRTATTGTGTLTLGGAVSGFLTFADAGVEDGDVVTYAIRDGASSEIGYGTYASAGSTLTRSVSKSTNGDAAISLSGNAEVVITPSAADLNGGRSIAVGVDFNDANSDTEMAIQLAGGYTRYRLSQLIISEASHDLTTATWGLFTAADGGGTAIFAAGQAITVSETAENTNNNMMTVAHANTNTQSFDATTLYFRVGTAVGAAATATVVINYTPVS